VPPSQSVLLRPPELRDAPFDVDDVDDVDDVAAAPAPPRTRPVVVRGRPLGELDASTERRVAAVLTRRMRYRRPGRLP
jgi:hypothetical protein